MAEANIESRRSDAYVAVSTALALNSSGDVASTGMVLRATRRLSPHCRESDDELIGLLVSIASKRTIALSFDHHDEG